MVFNKVKRLFRRKKHEPDFSDDSDDDESTTPKVIRMQDPAANSPELPGPSFGAPQAQGSLSHGAATGEPPGSLSNGSLTDEPQPQGSLSHGVLAKPKLKRLSFGFGSFFGTATGKKIKTVVSKAGKALKSILKRPGDKKKEKKLRVRIQEDKNEVFVFGNDADDQATDYSNVHFAPSPSSSSDSIADDAMPSTSHALKPKMRRQPSAVFKPWSNQPKDWEDDDDSDDDNIATMSQSFGSLNCVDDDVKASTSSSGSQTNISAVTFDNGSSQQQPTTDYDSTRPKQVNFDDGSSKAAGSGSESYKLPDLGRPPSFIDLVEVTDIHHATSAPKPKPAVRFSIDGGKSGGSKKTDRSSPERSPAKPRRSLGHWGSKFSKQSKDVRAIFSPDTPAFSSAPQPALCSTLKQGSNLAPSQSLKRKRDSELDFSIRRPQRPIKRQKTCRESEPIQQLGLSASAGANDKVEKAGIMGHSVSDGSQPSTPAAQQMAQLMNPAAHVEGSARTQQLNVSIPADFRFVPPSSEPSAPQPFQLSLPDQQASASVPAVFGLTGPTSDGVPDQQASASVTAVLGQTETPQNLPDQQASPSLPAVLGTETQTPQSLPDQQASASVPTFPGPSTQTQTPDAVTGTSAQILQMPADSHAQPGSSAVSQQERTPSPNQQQAKSRAGTSPARMQQMQQLQPFLKSVGLQSQNDQGSVQQRLGTSVPGRPPNTTQSGTATGFQQDFFAMDQGSVQQRLGTSVPGRPPWPATNMLSQVPMQCTATGYQQQTDVAQSTAASQQPQPMDHQQRTAGISVGYPTRKPPRSQPAVPAQPQPFQAPTMPGVSSQLELEGFLKQVQYGQSIGLYLAPQQALELRSRRGTSTGHPTQQSASGLAVAPPQPLPSPGPSNALSPEHVSYIKELMDWCQSKVLACKAILGIASNGLYAGVDLGNFYKQVLHEAEAVASFCGSRVSAGYPNNQLPWGQPVLPTGPLSSPGQALTPEAVKCFQNLLASLKEMRLCIRKILAGSNIGVPKRSKDSNVVKRVPNAAEIAGLRTQVAWANSIGLYTNPLQALKIRMNSGSGSGSMDWQS